MDHALCKNRGCLDFGQVSHACSPWLLAALLALPTLIGCAYRLDIVTGAPHAPAPPPFPANKEFAAGAAKIDITPPVGFPMGNYAEGGVWAYGTWTHLYARALYIQDAKQHAVTLVSCDLGSIPASLGDRVAEILAHDGETTSTHLGREQIILCATGTHHGPANFSSTEFFNDGMNLSPGFDPDLHDFLAERIASCIRTAFERRTPATIRFSRIRMRGDSPRAADPENSALANDGERPLLVNRSPLAFLRDGDGENIQSGAASSPTSAPTNSFPYIAAYREVVPTIAAMTLRRKIDHAIIGVAAFLAVQSPSVSRVTCVYNGELLGASAIFAEHRIASNPSAAGDVAAPVVAIFNGAEGDVVTTSQKSGRASTLYYANLIADSILGAADDAADSIPPLGQSGLGITTSGAPDKAESGYAVEGDIQSSFARKPLGETDRVPRPKYPGEPFLQTIFSFETYPAEVPIGVYRIGPIVIATLPGEFTTMMGQRIRIAVESALASENQGAPGDSPRPEILLAGMANEYASYFATPEEYAAQSYEGMWTLYGKSAGEIVKGHISDLARQLGSQTVSAPQSKMSYFPGIKQSFGMWNLTHNSHDPEDLSDILPDKADSLPERMQCCEWQETVVGNFNVPLPRVSISAYAQDIPDDSSAKPEWTDSDDGVNVLVICMWHFGIHSTWRAYWIPPHDTTPGFKYQFSVYSMNGCTQKIDSRDALDFPPP